MDFKDIHIGEIISELITKRAIDSSRVCNFLNCSESEIVKMYHSKSLDTEVLLRFSKLLKYDFFRLYSQHIILYAPQGNKEELSNGFRVPLFRKNIYTREVIDFILEMLNTENKTVGYIVKEYGIPRSTLQRWQIKYKITDK